MVVEQWSGGDLKTERSHKQQCVTVGTTYLPYNKSICFSDSAIWFSGIFYDPRPLEAVLSCIIPVMTPVHFIPTCYYGAVLKTEMCYYKHIKKVQITEQPH